MQIFCLQELERKAEDIRRREEELNRSSTNSKKIA